MGDSSADQTTNVTNIRKDNIFSNSGVSGDVLNVGNAGGDVVVTQERTDYGAISDAFDANQEVSRMAFEEAFSFGGTALDKVGETTKNALDANWRVTKDFLSSFDWQQQQTSNQVTRALDGMKSAITNDGAETMQAAFKWTAIAVGVAAGGYALSRMGS